MISQQTLDLFPYVMRYPIEDVLDWDLYGDSKLRWMLTDETWSNFHDLLLGLSLDDDWDEVDELGGERFLTEIQVIYGTHFAVMIYDREAQPADDDLAQDFLLNKELDEYPLQTMFTDDEEHLIDEP